MSQFEKRNSPLQQKSVGQGREEAMTDGGRRARRRRCMVTEQTGQTGRGCLGMPRTLCRVRRGVPRYLGSVPT